MNELIEDLWDGARGWAFHGHYFMAGIDLLGVVALLAVFAVLSPIWLPLWLLGRCLGR
jgi:hypothetical protein